jgi:hypothetical protein
VADRVIREDSSTIKESMNLFLKVIKNHFKIMKQQKKCLTLSFNYIFIKLLESKKLSEKQQEKLKNIKDEYVTLIVKMVPNPEVVLQELRKANGEEMLGKRKSG